MIKIVRLEAMVVALPMLDGFKTGFGNIARKQQIIVKLVTDQGVLGYGESSTLEEPVYNHETTASCLYVLEDVLAPRIVGKSFDTIEEFIAAYSDVIGNPAARAGVESAFWHLLAQEKNTSLKELFGGTQTNIKVGEGVGIVDSIPELLDKVQSHLAFGFSRIKVKIKPGWDIEPLTAIRQRWPDVPIMADGNSTYNLDGHADLLKSFEKFELEMLEQPLAADNFLDHAKLQAMTSTIISLDESIESFNDARTAIALQACRSMNIKIGRIGSIVEAMKIHDYAAEHNVGVWCGGMLETGVGRAFNLALASKPNYIHAADMSPYQLYFKDDITEPGLTIATDGSIEVPDEPGLGFAINQDKLKKYTVKTIIVN